MAESNTHGMFVAPRTRVPSLLFPTPVDKGKQMLPPSTTVSQTLRGGPQGLCVLNWSHPVPPQWWGPNWLSGSEELGCPACLGRGGGAERRRGRGAEGQRGREAEAVAEGRRDLSK